MTKSKPEYGEFKNSIPYVKWGNGNKNILIFSGGPGNLIPKGFSFNMMTKGFENLTEEYKLYMLGRKKNLSKGYTTKDMSDDYAEMIKEHFNSFVDIVMGMSYGGFILQHFAADYPDYYRHAVMAISAYKMNDLGKEVDYNFAKLISNGEYRKAAAYIINAQNPKDIMKYILKPLLCLFGNTMFKEDYESYKQDVLIEGEAEFNHDAGEKIKSIKNPMIIICGTNDFYFRVDYVKETHDMIKDSVLKLYEGKGHMDTLSDKRFSQDILDFINSK